MSDLNRIAAVASRHALSIAAVESLDAAMRSGRGGAQWSHPDLGGMGQWMRGGMLQIGDMFNHDLKARVAAALEDLAHDDVAPTRTDDPSMIHTATESGRWWPASLGPPSSTGSQNAMRYACFPDRRRLLVECDGRSTLYDTGDHRLTGFAQAQGETQTLVFSGPDGRISIDQLQAIA